MGQCDVNRARLVELAYAASVEPHDRFNIGTYNEKMLHRILKQYVSDDPSQQEVPCEGFIADVKTTDGIVEIQTSGFADMRDKLGAFLPLYPVTIVYPVAQRKWISWIDPATGDILARNRSPKTGRPFDAVGEMIYILPYLLHPHLTVRVLLLEIEEYRLLDGKRSRTGKRGSHRYERIPVDLYGAYDFHTTADYTALLPPDIRQPFTAKELAAALRYRGRHFSRVLRVLEAAGAISRDGQRGRAYLYRIHPVDGENFPPDTCK